MNGIIRDFQNTSQKKFDLIIIGGGIYGATLLLTASQAGKKALLLEKDDFGAATSFNNLRTVHGGLRYLQSLDIKRILESVKERRWFLRNFPDLVKPLPCLMPLYGNGVYKPSIFKFALLLNDLLSLNRNSKVNNENKLSSSRIISKNEVKKLFPQVDENNLKGGAIWYDGAMPDSQKIIIEIIKWACQLGGTALNYSEVNDLLVQNNKVIGIKANNNIEKESYEFLADKVINSAGPWSRKLAEKFDKDYPELFKDSIAWNILFNKPAISKYALAVRPKIPNSRMYFLHHWKGLLFAGTVHSTWNGKSRLPIPDKDSVKKFIDELNLTIKNINLKESDILQIFSGLLPAKEEGYEKLAVREIIIDHGKNNGPKGFFSVSGVKYTTARLVSEKTIKKIFGKNLKNINKDGRVSITREELGIFKTNWIPNGNNKWKENLKEIIENESVIHLDDLLIRRTSLGDNPNNLNLYLNEICELFDWNKNKKEDEIKRLFTFYNSRKIE